MSMNITVRTLDDKRHALKVEPGFTILDVKKQLANQSGTPLEHIRLVFKDVPLRDDDTVEAYDILYGSTILWLPCLNAGAKLPKLPEMPKLSERRRQRVYRNSD